jgi:hypothetical protein
MTRALYAAGWGYVAFCGLLVATPQARQRPAPHASAGPYRGEGSAWFAGMKPFCNAVEVEVQQQYRPAPAGVKGSGYSAACFALAGKIERARETIDKLPAGSRAEAAGIVFAVGHPVADAGDDRAAGPIMELVVDYSPNHYMALYHAGMAEYMLGQHDLARKNLTAFLDIYRAGDGWVTNAREVLARIDDPKGRGRELRRPREPGQ